MAAYRDTRRALRMLTATASAQGGYFTAKQARDAGYDYPHLEYHVKADNFQRTGHGLYRLPAFPPSEHDDLIRLALWSRGRDDQPQAVASHETALGVLGLGELLPKKVHLTVPQTFRKKPPRGVVLHRMKLAAGDVEERDGFRVTSAMRTLLDVSATDAVSQDQLERALGDALRLGLVHRTALTNIVQERRAAGRLAAALRKVRK